MPYQNNIPQPGDQLNDSQQDILDNFAEIQTLVGVNHVNFNVANQGKHTQVTLPENVAPTNTLLDEANIYSRLSALTAQTELVWQRENNGDRIEWTGQLAATNGWTRLPSGILLKWGVRAAAAGNPVVTVFPVAPNTPVFANVFTVYVSPAAAAASAIAVIIPASVTNLGFNANTFLSTNGAFNATTMFYLAIGN